MIGVIEQKALDRLKAANEARSNYKLAKIATYGGEFSQDNLRSVVRDFPAVWIMFDGAEAINDSQQRTKVRARFAFFVAAKSLRSEEEGRHGSSINPGAYTIIGDVLSLFLKQTLELDIDPFNLQDIRLIYSDRADSGLLSVYAIALTTSFDIEAINEEDNNVGVFATYHANWDIPIHGNVDRDIPSDDTADATDHVEMEQ
ncbi:MAG: hypothetical protein DI551_08210 [Micavibrio aeruginosavorus]|uniref:DUF1834 domain-containing protein n=1 Tax=Micavibrio aeruginosavorus TaxID=349221 RepID=A0A2W5MV49_9BACT|nr:MAG: hypothetical protein DI551_08210 [Micavibrio aeruginosavorus]